MSETRRWLDGPGFVRFLKREGVVLSSLSLTHQRAWNRWKNGSKVDFYRQDAFLLDIGIHETDIPEELWTVQTFKANTVSRRDKAVALAMLKDGCPIHIVADRFRVNRRTVYEWRRRLRRAGQLDSHD